MTSSVPTWIERLLGIPSGSGEGTVWSLEHSWTWPSWLTFVFVVFAVVFVVSTYWRENPEASRRLRMLAAVIRLSLVAIVLFMLAQMALSLSRTGLPYVAVLIDDSLSMTVVDRYDDKLREALVQRLQRVGLEDASRWNLARTLLIENEGSLLASLEKNYKLRLYTVSGASLDQASDSRQSNSLSLQERAGVRENGKAVRNGDSPHPNPLPEGEGTGDRAGLIDRLKRFEPRAESTRLGAGVRAVLDDLRGTAPAALILLSDGINTDGPGLAEAATLARRRGTPLFCIGLGDQRAVRDLKLSDLLVEDVVFLHDLVYFEAKLTASGFAGQDVRVVLRRKDKPGILAETTVNLDADGQSQQVRLAYRPMEEGEFQFVVEAEPLEGELETDNNRQERTVRVREEKIRVLMVQSYPNYEFRYLRNMLQRDLTLELHTLLQEADLEHAEQGHGVLRGFPVRREELFKYDVIILGDMNPALLSASMLKDLAEFVEQPGKGGAMILIAGPRFMPAAFRDTPLARLLPMNLGTVRYPDPGQNLTDGFVVQPTGLGLSSPQMQLGDTPSETAKVWESLAPLYWLLEVPDLKPGVRVLAEHPTKVGHEGRRLPVISMQYVGAGKVLFHATDETWRWRYRVGDVYFARYWIQTIRFLARSKLTDGENTVLLTADRREYRRGEPVLLRARFVDERQAPASDDGVTIVLEHKDHKTERLKLQRTETNRGVFEIQLTDPGAGTYHAWLALPTPPGRAPAVDFTVAAPPGEFERVEMDAAELGRAAEVTKGKSYTFSTANHLLRDLPEGRQVPIETLRPLSLWNQWPLLLVFLVLLTTEWVLRKIGGMV